MSIYRFALLVGITLFSWGWARAQCNSFSDKICQNIPMITCDVDELIGNICSLQEPETYNPDSDPDIPDEIPNCTNEGNAFRLQNPDWYSFIATSNTARITMRIYNCTGSQAPGEDGIQYALIENCSDMKIFDCVSESTGGFLTTFNIDYFDLSVGKTYYFVIDGFAASVCTYEFRNISGFGNFVLEDIGGVVFENFPADTICAGLDSTVISLVTSPGENLNSAEITHWELYHLPDAVTPILDTVVSGIKFDYEFILGGDYELRVEASNSCQATNMYLHQFYVEEIEEMVMDTFTFCLEDLSDAIPDFPDDPRYLGGPITSIVDNPFIDTIYSGNGCPTIQIVPLDPIMPSLREEVQMVFCNEDSILFEGSTYYTSVLDSLMTLDNQSQSGCDSLILLNLALLKVDGFIAVTNCEDGISEISFMPISLEPAGQLDSVEYIWRNGAGNVLTDKDNDSFPHNQIDSIFLEVILYKFGETCSSDFSAFAEPGTRSLTAECIQTEPGTLALEWNHLPGILSYGVVEGSDTLYMGLDTSFSTTGLQPGSTVMLDIYAQSDADCPELTTSIVCQVEDCDPNIELSLIPADTLVCLGTGVDFIDFGYILTGDNSTGQISWKSNGIFDSGTSRFDILSSGPGDYEVVVFYTEGPCIYSDTTCVIIDRLPNAAFTIEQEICATDTAFIRLEMPVEPDWTLDWNIGGDFSLERLDDSTFGVFWQNPGNFEIHLGVSNGGCAPSDYMTVIEVYESIPSPNIRCSSREDVIDFYWDALDCANEFEIFINGVAQGQVTDTFYTVEGLMLGDSVELEVIPLSGCFCAAPSDRAVCYTQICPNAEFLLDSLLCEEDTAFIELVHDVEPGFQVELAIDGVHILEPDGMQAYRVHWIEPGTFEVRVTVDNGSCISEEFSQTVEVTPSVEMADVFCQSFLDRVEFSWNPVDCGASYDIFRNDQFVGNQTDTFFVFDGLIEGESVEATIIPVSACACPGVGTTLICQARSCADVLVEISEIGTYCIPPGAVDSLQLQVNIVNPTIAGTGSWIGSFVDGSGLFNSSLAGFGSHLIIYEYIEDGCIYRDSISIDVLEAPEMEIYVTSPECPNQVLGNLEVQASGGSGVYTFLIDGDTIPDPVNNPLGDGLHFVEVIDDNGCMVSAANIEILPPPGESIQISGPDSAVEGESMEHVINTTVQDSSVSSIDWLFNSTVLCSPDDCSLELHWSGEVSGELCAIIYYGNNCSIMDCIELRIARDFKVYYPNIFSPYGSISNGVFWIHSNDPNAVVEELQVFDRWGNMVYSVRHAAMEGDSSGWDGTFNGAYVNPGVYVFKADLIFEDGTMDSISGSLTLIH